MNLRIFYFEPVKYLQGVKISKQQIIYKYLFNEKEKKYTRWQCV